MTLTQTIPALPVRDMAAAIAWYVDKLGFGAVHTSSDFAVLERDQATLHLWAAADETWSERSDFLAQPVCSGGESFIAGTASCRIQVSDSEALETLYTEYAAAGVLHPVSRDGISDTDFGAREFHTLDPAGNLISFFVWLRPGA